MPLEAPGTAEERTGTRAEVRAKLRPKVNHKRKLRILAAVDKPCYMQLSRILFLSFTCLLGLQAGVQAQSAQEVVSKYLAALGGKEKLQSINSLYREGVAVLDGGAQIMVKTWRVYDRLYREELSSASGKLVIIVTPNRGWYSAPGSGGLFKPLTPDQYRALVPEIDPAGPLVDYNQKGNKIELAGRDTVQGEPCYKLRVYFPSGNAATYSIDAKTGYSLKSTYRGNTLLSSIFPDESPLNRLAAAPAGQVTTEFSDYKIIPGGYIFPYTIALSPYGAKVTIKKVEVNGNVDADALSRPK